MEIIKKVQPPQGLSRFVFRLPIYLYEAGLGGLLGNHVLLINHIGRVTGKPRQVVLEVIKHDPSDGSYLVASGWGPSAQWYRNVLHTPDVTIQVGGKTIPVTGTPLPLDEQLDLIEKYYWRNRVIAKQILPRLYGYKVDGSREDFRQVAEHVPVIRFVPRF